MTEKEYNTHCKLNELYLSTIEESDFVKKHLEDKGFEVKVLFANKHYAEYKGEFLLEYYPLRVLDVEDVGDFIFNFTAVSFEKYYNTKDLLELNLEKIIKQLKESQLDFYSEDNCCNSLYKKGMRTADLKTIINSIKARVAINFQLEAIEKDILFILENLVVKNARNKI